jgi:hypothetical protein
MEGHESFVAGLERQHSDRVWCCVVSCVALSLRGSFSFHPLLQGLSMVIEAGFFMTQPNIEALKGKRLETAADEAAALARQLADEQEHGLVTSAAWALLDVVIACVCDATLTVVDALHTPLVTFINAALRCAGANADASSRAHANDGGPPATQSTSSPPASRSLGATQSSSQHPPQVPQRPRHLPPCGLHPATLHRLLSAAMAAHTFCHHKREYARAAWLWCADQSEVPRDMEKFRARMVAVRWRRVVLGLMGATVGSGFYFAACRVVCFIIGRLPTLFAPCQPSFRCYFVYCCCRRGATKLRCTSVNSKRWCTASSSLLSAVRASTCLHFELFGSIPLLTGDVQTWVLMDASRSLESSWGTTPPLLPQRL